MRDKDPRDMMSTSYRAPRDLIQRAKAKAGAEGLTVTELMTDLLEGYVRNVYILPTRIFPSPAELHASSRVAARRELDKKRELSADQPALDE